MRREDVMQVLNDPIAVELLHSRIPARLAYTRADGSPRVVPLAFHWDEQQFVIGTAPKAPKVRALAANPKVALTIDTESHPPHILLVRGTAGVEIVDGIPPGYLAASKKVVGADQWDEFVAQVSTLYKQMALITIVPEWAKVLDFETRIPSAVEQLIKEQQRRSPMPPGGRRQGVGAGIQLADASVAGGMF